MAVVALVVMCCAVGGRAHAQGIGTGVKGGFLFSSFDFDEASDLLDSSNGWMAGLFFGGNRPGRVGVMGEINLLATRGETGMDSTTIYYAQVPVLLRVNVGSRNIRGPSVYGIIGPAIDLKIGEDLADVAAIDVKSGGVNIVAGAGAELAGFIVEARGTWALRNIATDPAGADIDAKTFAVLLGLRFN